MGAKSVGQCVEVEMLLMAEVPLCEVWLDANFKKTQLKDSRIGQRVCPTSNLDRESVDYHGYLQGLDSGVGNSFSLLTAQHTSVNWIKNVQRLPAQITRGRKELDKPPCGSACRWTPR